MVKKTSKKSSGFSLAKLWAEGQAIVLTPKKAFQGLSLTADYSAAIIKVILYSVLAVLINFIWGLLRINVAPTMTAPTPNIISLLIVAVVASVVGLFIGGAIVWIIAMLCKGNKTYLASIQVAAALAVMNPLIAIFGFTYLNISLGIIVSTLLSLFSLWLLYNALLVGLKCQQNPVKIIVIVLAVLVVLSNLNLLFTYKTIAHNINFYQK